MSPDDKSVGIFYFGSFVTLVLQQQGNICFTCKETLVDFGWLSDFRQRKKKKKKVKSKVALFVDPVPHNSHRGPSLWGVLIGTVF